jgi:TRAP-type C4-dicarboxylate transport system permease large subunit
MIPSMIKQGYGKDYAVAIIASAATIGPIIPPSIAMIMYAHYTGLSVGKLFLGGFVPGVLIGVGLMIVLAVAGVFSNILTRLHFQDFVINNIVLRIADPYLATLAIMLIIVPGCFIDLSVLIVMFGSAVHTAGVILGFDPIHYRANSEPSGSRWRWFMTGSLCRLRLLHDPQGLAGVAPCGSQKESCRIRPGRRPHIKANWITMHRASPSRRWSPQASR